MKTKKRKESHISIPKQPLMDFGFAILLLSICMGVKYMTKWGVFSSVMAFLTK